MAFDAAKQYLERVLPWAPVGDPTAFVNIHWGFQKPSFVRPAFSGRACMSVQEAINVASWADRMPDTVGVYACMSTQRTFEEKVSQNGRTYRNATRGQQNAVQIRSLFIDIDGYKDYPTKAEALMAFMEFLKTTGLPRPNVTVDSGGGLHVYWTLDKALSLAAWQPLANALVEAIRRAGLKCDMSCTVDGARLLRVPDTMNRKRGRDPAPVKLLPPLPFDYTVEQMHEALAPFMGAQVIPLTPRGNLPKLEGGDELGAGIETRRAPPIDLDTVAAAGCGFIGHAIATGGKDYAQPLWNLSTLVATFAEGGRADAHRMANGHPSYSQQDTDELYDRKERERAEKNLGWPSCQTIENSGCTACATCSLKAPGTRPLQFGSPSVQAVQQALVQPTGTPVSQTVGAVPDLPAGYVTNGNHQVFKQLPSDSGGNVLQLVCPYAIFDPWVQDDPWTFHFKTRLGHTTRASNISVVTAQANSAEGFGKAVGMQGMALGKTHMNLLRELIVAWQSKLQAAKDMVVSSAPFGWSAPNGKIDGFVFNSRVWQVGQDRPAAHPDPVMAAQYTPRGDLQPWIDAAKMVTDLGTPERDCFIAASFAGPLVRFTNHPGLLVSAYSSGSGKGKSTALAIGQAVWGDPVRAKQSLTDTQNSVINKMGTLRSLPMFWDELQTSQDASKFVSLTFQLSGGKEKGRLGADAAQRAPGTWQTLLMSASNDSILDHVTRASKTTTAGIYRVFEFTVPHVPYRMTGTAANQLLLKLNDNFGQAGLVYAKFLGENYDRVHKEVVAMHEALERRLDAVAEERFWIGTMTVLLMGARYSNELNLTQIDLPAFTNFLVRTLRAMRREIISTPTDMSSSLSASNILAQYINHVRSRHMLVTNRIHVGAGRPAHGEIRAMMDTTRLDGMFAHYGEDQRLLRFAAGHFRSWLSDNSFSPHIVCEALTKSFGMRAMTARLGSGTGLVSLSEHVFELDLTHPELAQFVDAKL